MGKHGLVQARLSLFQPRSQSAGMLTDEIDNLRSGGIEGSLQRGMMALQRVLEINSSGRK